MPPIRLSKTRELTLPLMLLVSLVAAGAAAYARWTATEEKVVVHEKRLDAADERFKVNEAQRAADHDILLEIRGDVKAMYRERRTEERRTNN